MSGESRLNLRWLEDVFARSGLPVHCVELDASALPDSMSGSGPVVEVVFPLNEEHRVFPSIEAARPEIRQRFGEGLVYVPRTILYHMAVERFGGLASEAEGYFLSPRFENLETPEVRPIDVLENGILGASVLNYRLNMVVVGRRRQVRNREKVIQEVLDTARQFNANSRYMKLSRLGIGFRLGALVWKNEPDTTFEDLPL